MIPNAVLRAAFLELPSLGRNSGPSPHYHRHLAFGGASATQLGNDPSRRYIGGDGWRERQAGGRDSDGLEF